MTQNFLEIENATFSASKKNKVNDVSLTIEKEGEIICLLGPSGIGKTTMLRTIAGLQNLQFGKIKLRKEEALKVYPSTFKAQKLIQWNPKISFSNGLKRTIKYYKKSKFN